MPRIRIYFSPLDRHGNVLVYSKKTPKQCIQQLVKEAISFKFINPEDLRKWSETYGKKDWLNRFRL